MKRPTLPAVCVVMLLAGAGAADARQSALSNEAQLVKEALEKICLPAVAGKADVAALASAAGFREHVINSSGARVMLALGEGDRFFPHPKRVVTVTAYADGSCSVASAKGNGGQLMAAAEQSILGRPEGYAAGRIGLDPSGRKVLRAYCAKADARHLAVAAAYGVKRFTLPLNISVQEESERSALHCTPKGSPDTPYGGA